VLSVIVAIDYELQTFTARFIATVHAIFFSSIFILRFISSYCFFASSIYFTLLVSCIVVSLFLVLRSYSTLYLG